MRIKHNKKELMKNMIVVQFSNLKQNSGGKER